VILGMVELEYKEGESKGEFRRMSISKDARRLGLARKFVLNLNDFAKIEGYKEVFQKIQRRRVWRDLCKTLLHLQISNLLSAFALNRMKLNS